MQDITISYMLSTGHGLNIESRNMFCILSEFVFSGVDMPNAKTNKTTILIEVGRPLVLKKHSQTWTLSILRVCIWQ